MSGTIDHVNTKSWPLDCAIDSGNYSVRIFFADFTKGFDIIDHSVLPDELKSFDIGQTLFFWVRSFLTDRVQAVRVGSSLSSWKQVNSGVPQGTKLRLTLFAVMINKLLRNWHMRSKYVGDTQLRLSQEMLLVY